MNLDKILGKNIEGFYLKKDSDFNIISMIIKIETVLLEVFVNEDTDTLKLKLISGDEETYIKEYVKINFFDKIFMGKKIISYWKTQNHLGYFDVFLIGLDEFIPSISFSVISSQIKIGILNYSEFETFSKN